MNMFCRQCEQTAKGEGCTIRGVCGKSPEVSALIDLVIYSLKGLGMVGQAARSAGIKDSAADLVIIHGLFATVTNVDFDPQRLADQLREIVQVREELKGKIKAAAGKVPDNEYTSWQAAADLPGLYEQAKIAGVISKTVNPDIQSAREILLYGMKGMAAYADHAQVLGKIDETVNSFFYKGLAALTEDALSLEALVALIMEFGKVNLKCLEILDRAHQKHFGQPLPTKVSLGVKKGPAIIVSGHDLDDLKQLLEQTVGKGINIYTHGEMLPAHGYPELKKFPHLAGHFGTAWQNQHKEFEGQPAAFLFTTNCIQQPRESYRDRMFTTGLVAWPGETHIWPKNGKKDFSPVISKALELGGFSSDSLEKEILVGFGWKTVLGLADKVLALVSRKKLRHIFLIGGCDGAKPGRNYFTEFAEKTPKDSLILTLACGKFRFNRLDFGDIEGIPRLLDCGQCNDAYSAIQIAVALATRLGVGVNDLPLSFILSWYEQKAVCILLTLLSLGVKNIRLGPTLPAFVSPNIVKFLVDNFNIQPITTAEADIKAII